MTDADFDALAKKVRQEQHGSWDFDSIEFARRLRAAWLAENEPVAWRQMVGLKWAAAPDADGHCTICGLPWPDERETLEPHECPPGFKR